MSVAAKESAGAWAIHVLSSFLSLLLLSDWLFSLFPDFSSTVHPSLTALTSVKPGEDSKIRFSSKCTSDTTSPRTTWVLSFVCSLCEILCWVISFIMINNKRHRGIWSSFRIKSIMFEWQGSKKRVAFICKNIMSLKRNDDGKKWGRKVSKVFRKKENRLLKYVS